MESNPIVPEKICTKCKIEKKRDEYGIRRRAKDGLFSECKSCRSKHAKKRYIKNKPHINEINAKWKADNAEKHRAINAAWRANNPERHSESGKRWYADNRDARKKTIKKWYQANVEKVIARNAKWKIEHPEQARIIRLRTGRKIRSTPKGKLNCSMSSAIHTALRGNKAGRRWEHLVGYTVFNLKEHLEKHFLQGMTWENYGGIWEIDHKIPKIAFNYENPEDIDFKRCWSLKNLQPLWRSANRRKSGKINKSFQPSLLIREVVNG